jgi:hypothetical protein
VAEALVGRADAARRLIGKLAVARGDRGEGREVLALELAGVRGADVGDEGGMVVAAAVGVAVVPVNADVAVGDGLGVGLGKLGPRLRGGDGFSRGGDGFRPA